MTIITERPLVVKIICALGFIQILLVLFSIYTMPDHLINGWYPPYKLLSAIIILSCMLAFWHMLKLAIYFYTAFAILNQLVLHQFGNDSIYFVIIPVIILFIGWMPLKNTFVSN